MKRATDTTPNSSHRDRPGATSVGDRVNGAGEGGGVPEFPTAVTCSPSHSSLGCASPKVAGSVLGGGSTPVLTPRKRLLDCEAWQQRDLLSQRIDYKASAAGVHWALRPWGAIHFLFLIPTMK